MSGQNQAVQSGCRSEKGIQRPGVAGLKQLKDKFILIDVYIWTNLALP